MKFIVGFILSNLFTSYLTMAQKEVEFNIVFGNYFNDHNKNEFQTTERNWILKDGRLIYLIDAHNTRYSDTILLNKSDIQSITRFIEDSKLDNSITKDISEDYFRIMELSTLIKGNIYVRSKSFEFIIKSNSSSLLDEDLDAQKIKKIEDLLYKIIESY